MATNRGQGEMSCDYGIMRLGFFGPLLVFSP